MKKQKQLLLDKGFYTNLSSEDEEELCFSEFEITLEELSKKIEEKQTKFQYLYPLNKFKLEININFVPYREETDKEYEIRINKEKIAKEKQEKKERELLEKLKKKYEKTGDIST